MDAIESGIELLTSEYISEVVGAGGHRYMQRDDLATFISELVLGNYGSGIRKSHGQFALQTAHMLLLPEECRRRGIEVDRETIQRLKEALS